MAHIDLAEGSAGLRPPGWVRVPEHPALRGLHRPGLTTRLPRQFLEQSSPGSTTIPTKDEGRRMKAEDSQQTISRELQPENRQVRLVYRRWNFAGKVPLSL